MSRKSRFRKKINIIGLLLLAVLCIGGVELLVCRFASPQLFDRITQPVLSFGLAGAWTLEKSSSKRSRPFIFPP